MEYSHQKPYTNCFSKTKSFLIFWSHQKLAKSKMQRCIPVPTRRTLLSSLSSSSRLPISSHLLFNVARRPKLTIQSRMIVHRRSFISSAPTHSQQSPGADDVPPSQEEHGLVLDTKLLKLSLKYFNPKHVHVLMRDRAKENPKVQSVIYERVLQQIKEIESQRNGTTSPPPNNCLVSPVLSANAQLPLSLFSPPFAVVQELLLCHNNKKASRPAVQQTPTARSHLVPM